MSEKIAVFPGTFDPVTLGHVDIVRRGLTLFDKIIIALGVNTNKKNLFSEDQRLEWMRRIFEKESRVEVNKYEGLTVQFCRETGAHFILRGLRNGIDFDYETHIAQVNRKLDPGIETVFMNCAAEYSYISSTIVRDLIIYKGDFSSLVPAEVKP